MTGSAAQERRDDWDAHWEAYAASAARNPAQEYRRRLILDFLGRDGPPTRLLDIGAGSGDLAAEVRRVFPRSEILGLELSPAGVERARAKVPDASFVAVDLLHAGDPDPAHRGWATHAVCSEVLEHVDEPGRLLANVLPYLAPGCRLVVTVPGGPMSSFDRHLGHRRHYRPAALARILEGAGLEVKAATGAGFPFFNLYRLVVVARGRRLIVDVEAGAQSPAAGTARAAMGLFRVLFRLNLDSSPWGWQTIASARMPGGAR